MAPEPIASILLGYRVLRGTAGGPEYLSAFVADDGDLLDRFEWTPDRETAILFGHRDDADAIRERAVDCENRCAAVVPGRLDN